MAVELAKLSLWLFTMDSGRPLSFLNHHLKCGNSLIGAWIKDLGELPEFDRNGKPKRKQTPEGQGNLFEHQFKARVPLMIRDVFGIMKTETVTYEDIEAKKALDQALEDLKRPFKNVADAWVGTFFGEKVNDYYTFLSNITQASNRKSQAKEKHMFFHWELEFPEVFFDEFGRHLAIPAFSVVFGNPPYLYSVGKSNATYFKCFSFAEYQTDYYVYFYERGFLLLQRSGVFGMIGPDSWLGNKYFYKLRNFLLENRLIYEICLFTEPPFEDAVIENAILIANSSPVMQETCNIRTVAPDGNTVSLERVPFSHLSSRQGKTIPSRYNPEIESLLTYIEAKCDISLKDEFFVNRGVHAYRTDGYGKSKFGNGPQTEKDKNERSYHAISRLNSTYRPFIKGSDIDLFCHPTSVEYISYGDWLAEPRTLEYFEGPRIVARKIIGKRIIATLFVDDSVLDQALYIAIPQTLRNIDEIKFYLGQLTSRISAFYLRNKHQLFDVLYPWFTREQFANFPLISFEKAGKAKDKVVRLVSELLQDGNRKHQGQKLLELDKVCAELLGITNQQLEILLQREEI